jgi:hypothetical protein
VCKEGEAAMRKEGEVATGEKPVMDERSSDKSGAADKGGASDKPSAEAANAHSTKADRVHPAEAANVHSAAEAANVHSAAEATGVHPSAEATTKAATLCGNRYQGGADYCGCCYTGEFFVDHGCPPRFGTTAPFWGFNALLTERKVNDVSLIIFCSNFKIFTANSVKPPSDRRCLLLGPDSRR